MALTRKFLASKGIEEDVAEEIVKAHLETVSGLKDELEQYKKYKSETENVEKLKTELESLKDAQKKLDALTTEHEKLKKEHSDYKSGIEARDAKTAKENAYRELLKKSNIPEKYFSKIIKCSDIDGLKLDKEGKFENAEELAKGIKEDWGDFVTTTQTQGAQEHNPPQANHDSPDDTSYAAKRVAQYQESHYGGVAKQSKED